MTGDRRRSLVGTRRDRGLEVAENPYRRSLKIRVPLDPLEKHRPSLSRLAPLSSRRLCRMAARSCGSANRYSLKLRRKSGDISASTSLNSSSAIVTAPLRTSVWPPVQLQEGGGGRSGSFDQGSPRVSGHRGRRSREREAVEQARDALVVPRLGQPRTHAHEGLLG